MLQFISGTTVAPNEFKTMHSASKLEYAKKEGSDKIYFKVDGIIRGACSRKGIPTKPVISQVVGDDGVPFYLVHETPVIRDEVILGEF